MKTYRILFQIGVAAILPTGVNGAVINAINYGAPSPSEAASLGLINRFRADPVNELARMFNDNFGTNYTNATLAPVLSSTSYTPGFWTSTFGNNIASGSMNFFNTVPKTLYDEFQVLTAKSTLAWNNNLGWAAHQYSVSVEQDAGTSNPHFVPGAPVFIDRFNNVGVNYTSIGENIAPNWPDNPAAMHMGFAVDWGSGPGGMQNLRGHRNSMLSTTFTAVGIGTLDAGWTAGQVSQVQHLAAFLSVDRIAYGYVYTDTSATTKANGATVNIYDAADNLLGSATTDSTGAYTYKVAPGAAAPATAEYILNGITTPRHTLGNDGNTTWFLDAAVIPEPSSALLAGLTILGACVRRRRVG